MWNRFFYAFCIGIFLHHLIATALFLLPVNKFSRSYSEYVSGYMLPLFYQRWKLFAPDPPMTSLHFLYRCKVKGDWVDWRDLSSNLQHEFSQNPFGGAGKFLLVQNSIGQKAVKSEYGYRKANSSAYEFCKKEFGPVIEETQIRIAHIKTKPFDKRTDADFIPEKTLTNFPSLRL